MNLIIREGKTWPFEKEFETMEDYRGYFLSHAAFVVQSQHFFKRDDVEYAKGTMMGCFYIKPNFPGRCSHICDGGFITSPPFRQLGVGSIMGKGFLKLAKDLGCKSSYFNLVSKSNRASIRLWEKLGFERVTVLENSANLKGVSGLDTDYGYRYDLESLPEDYTID